MADDLFKDELARIARNAQERHESEFLRRQKRAREFRDNAEDAFKTAVAFNTRVITPLLADFSASAPGAGEFECEFKDSDAQPEFVHVCKMHGQRLTVSLLYWIAGSARLNCGFGYVINDEPFKIESFSDPDLDERTRTWLKARLIEKYRGHVEQHCPYSEETAQE